MAATIPRPAFKVAGNRVMSYNGAAKMSPSKKTNPWEPWYAWRPVRVGRKVMWRKWIYRRHVLSPGGGFYQYGTEFDVMRWTPDE